MALIPWNDSLKIGILRMDDQHQHWIRLINQLHEAMLQGQGAQVINQTLGSILSYTQAHFSSEEKLMSQHGYPTCTQHKQLHDQFIKKMEHLKQRADQGDVFLSTEIMQEMRHWLMEHIQKTDRQYAVFLKQKGVA